MILNEHPASERKGSDCVFVFYDTETTGLSQDFSQILQIALVFTDADLNILSSKKMECRSSPWVVPSPGAMLTTGFSPDDLKFSKHSNYEMMQEVDEWLRRQHWPLTFVGYNSIRYDEPLLAQNFHQNLLDPGLTSSKNGANNQSNGCGDVMLLVKAVAAYMPGALKLDILNSYGSPSMTLQNVALQNGIPLSDNDAHDAMNDTKATVGVAKLLRKAAPQVWDQMMKLTTVEGVNTFLATNDIFTYTTTSGKGKSSVMTSLIEREGSATQALYDLSVDPAPYMSMTVEQLKDVFLSKDKGGKKNPFALMRKNSQPILMPMELSEPVIPPQYNAKTYAIRANMVRSDKKFLERVAEAALLAKQEKTPVATPDQLSEMMIDKTISASARPLLDKWVNGFHDAAKNDWNAAAGLVTSFAATFKDELKTDPSLARFALFAERVVYEHAPKVLAAEKQEAMKKSIAARVLNTDLNAPYMTIAKARKELEGIEKARAKGAKQWADVTDTQIRSLKLYYTAIEKEYAAHVPALPVNDNAPAPTPPVKKSFNGPKL